MANDMTILAIGVSLFLFLGFIIPFVNSEFDTSHTELQTESLTGEVGTDPGDDVTAFEVLKSMLSIWFWSISGIPVWLNLILWIPRLVLYITIARNIWIGGGA